MSEARDVLNDSLLASPSALEARNVGKKLNLWKDKDVGVAEEPKLNIPFYLYPHHVCSVSKHKLGTEIQPIYQIAIVRSVYVFL